jgi:hypothetical protein
MTADGSGHAVYDPQTFMANQITIALACQWRRPGPYAPKAAALAAASVIVTPYLQFYDLLVLVVSACFLVRHWNETGTRTGDRLVLFACFMALFVPPPIFPVGPFVASAVFLLALRASFARAGSARSVA